MSSLAIALFGGFQVKLDGRSLTSFGTDKNRALLAYLALESDHPHRREILASLLWPHQPETRARNSLRQALFQLRKILECGEKNCPHLIVEPGQVQFNPASNHWVDVLEFNTRLSACQSHHPQGSTLCSDCRESLQRAVGLYQGDLLAGVNLPACTRFTDWQVINQEAQHRRALIALSLLEDFFQKNLLYAQLIACLRRTIELEPWSESVHYRTMWALAVTGQRQQAIQQYETISETLQRELGIAPMDKTRQLYEHICSNDFRVHYDLQGEFNQPAIPTEEPLRKAHTFVGRKFELAQLHKLLGDALSGQGRTGFIRGEAGSGKTALMHEFALRAMREVDDLLVAGGTCSAMSEMGDLYQPFREMLRTLIGINPVPFAGSTLSHEHIWRLRKAHPAIVQIAQEVSPELVSSLFPMLEQRLQIKSTLKIPPPEAPLSQKAGLYDQVARLLLAVSQKFPLLILLDDLQWLDEASASLLFHLGGHISGGHILLLGTYRPEDIAPVQGPDRHPLIPIITEFQRRFGEMLVDLSRADGRTFSENYLDREPNRFDQDFRGTLYRHTGGNALFTVELISAMKASAELTKDKNGRWRLASSVDWDRLPARVRAVIAERLSRLDGESHALLRVACIQGNKFSAQSLALNLGGEIDEIIFRLSGHLSKQHHLVKPLGIVEEVGENQALYQFCCLLIKKYLYQSLDEVERKYLQRVPA